MEQRSETIFMLFTLNPDMAMLWFDMLSPDMELSSIMPVTLTLCPTCGF